MIKKLIVLCLLLVGCHKPQYHLYVYYAKTCPRCYHFINQTIPLIEERYGNQILVTAYDIDELDFLSSYQETCSKLAEFPLSQNKGSVPFIVLDGYFAKVGYQESQQDLLLEAIECAINHLPLPPALDDIYEFKKD